MTSFAADYLTIKNVSSTTPSILLVDHVSSRPMRILRFSSFVFVARRQTIASNDVERNRNHVVVATSSLFLSLLHSPLPFSSHRRLVYVVDTSNTLSLSLSQTA